MFGPNGIKKKKVKKPVVPCEMDLPETDEITTEDLELEGAQEESQSPEIESSAAAQSESP